MTVLVVVDSPRGGAPINADAASFEAVGKLRARAETAGVATEFRQHDHTEVVTGRPVVVR